MLERCTQVLRSKRSTSSGQLSNGIAKTKGKVKIHTYMEIGIKQI